MGGEVHHIPANDVSPTSKAKGTAIWMETTHHKVTASNGPGTSAKIYRSKQQELISDGKTNSAIAKDIADVNRVAPGLYTIPLLQMLKVNQRNKSNAKPNSK